METSALLHSGTKGALGQTYFSNAQHLKKYRVETIQIKPGLAGCMPVSTGFFVFYNVNWSCHGKTYRG